MPAYVIVQVEIQDPAAYERYKALAPGSIEAYGGRYLARGGHSEALEGEWGPCRVVILEFDDVARAKRWLDSPEYREARALRHASARTQMIVVEGLPR
ncbi:MAG TPA: DUF1330 domain-containing protein [Candidatus Krumholzibacteria bacterium]|nr:DUF1330 domain-containing protein [Candidatus Krumholzibacteria bacterium]